ncbi:phosphate acyltransferase PlsX [Synechococcus sp. PCC 7336]|uniref:phosphate acyltransferase PlsX n=1 Tax=Synechococcus sp. PCC 7336 TaxID=195250 RepID=UPI00034BC99B|nr:phosphate acyltransferase PlsX [Synechococcus sp. PCC 7336]
MRIAVDAMGGDYAPAEIVKGALLAHSQHNIDIALVGRPDAMAPHLPSNLPDGIEIVEAEDDIGMGEEPIEALRRKRKASIRVTMDLVRKRKADAAVAAGNTGAAMAAALLRLGRIPGIDRPAIAAMFPTLAQKPVMILDVGANVDSRPKFLEHFAIMGSLYSECVLGVNRPKVGLLNIGEEASKGNEQVVTAYQHLKQLDHINFVGNAEGRDVLTGDFDVVVCDGFVGNILLKFAESVGMVATQILREELPRGWHGKLGATILMPNLKNVKRRMDYAEYGGGLLLGVNGVCIITHGSSKAGMVSNAIRLAKEAVEHRVIDRIQAEIVTARETIEGQSAATVSPATAPVAPKVVSLDSASREALDASHMHSRSP